LTRRNLWIHTLKLNVPISKWHRVCSKHFAKNSYIFSNCRKMLHPNAVPLSHSEIVEDDVCNPTKLNYQNSDESVTFGFLPTCSASTDVCEVFPESNVEIVNEVCNSTKLNYQNSDESVIFGFSPSSSVSTKVAKVAKEGPSTSVNMFPSHTNRRKFWNSSRVGDLEEDDFSMPKRRKQNFMMIQRTVSNLR
ncbi:THAP domain-containing protein 2, partial [Aphis craccivora]